MNFLTEMFLVDSKLSSSRVYAFIVLIAVILFAVVFALVSFLGQDVKMNVVTVIQAILGTLTTIFGICLGGSTISKFSKGQTQVDVTPKDDQNG